MSETQKSTYNDGRVTIPNFKGDLSRVAGGHQVIIAPPAVGANQAPQPVSFNTGRSAATEAVIPTAFVQHEQQQQYVDPVMEYAAEAVVQHEVQPPNAE